RSIAAMFTAMERLATRYTDTPSGSTAFFQLPFPFDFRQDIARIDYSINSKHSMYGRYLHDNYVLVDNNEAFIDSPLPIIATDRNRPGYSFQLGHIWLISPKLINEAKINTAWHSQRVHPLGDSWKRETYGFTYPQIFPGETFDNSLPDISFSGTGGFNNFEAANGILIAPTTDISISDNLTIIRGKNTFKVGGIFIRNRKDQNGRTASAGSVNFNTNRPNSTRISFGDALLGNYRTYTEANQDPLGFFRFTQVEAYAADTWKVLPRLSLDLG